LPPNVTEMRFKFILVFLLIFALSSCKNDNEKRQEEAKKDIKRKELIFSIIDKAWVFNVNALNSTSQANTVTWKEWSSFLSEFDQKPKKTIGAFQKKSKELSNKVMILTDVIPVEFAVPQIKARIAILITKVRMLDLYMHLAAIPDQKIVALIPEINTELTSLQNQMNKIILKSKIPLEDGESELRKMLDTTRAIPNNPQSDPNSPRAVSYTHLTLPTTYC
jgi:hypothetical protein